MGEKQLKKAMLGSSILLAGNRKAILEEGEDANSVVSRHYRVVNGLVVLLKKGKLELTSYEAAQKFAENFQAAGFNGLHAFDYRAQGGDSCPDAPTERIFFAQKAVHRALQTVGGLCSPCGKLLWEVVGEGVSLNQWAASNKWEYREALGILVGALSAVAVCYGYVDPQGNA
jgi:hypothetical protein